jgi:hypothetical protein
MCLCMTMTTQIPPTFLSRITCERPGSRFRAREPPRNPIISRFASLEGLTERLQQRIYPCLRCRIIGVHADREPIDICRLLHPFSQERPPFSAAYCLSDGYTGLHCAPGAPGNPMIQRYCAGVRLACLLGAVHHNCSWNALRQYTCPWVNSYVSKSVEKSFYGLIGHNDPTTYFLLQVGKLLQC